MEKVNENERQGGTMQITIYIYHTGAPDDPSKLTDTLVDRIEYAGQMIVFKDGKIYGCLCEEPEEPASFCETWNDCKLRLLSGGCLPDAQCVHRVKPARRPNMPPVMHL